MTSYTGDKQTDRTPFTFGSVWEFLGRRRGGEGRRWHITDFITYLYLLVGAVVMFGPVVWLVMSSFKDESLINAPNPTFLPYRQQTAQVEVDGELRTARLYDVTFKDTYFGSAETVLPDIRADNGVIHVLDQVLVPEGLQAELRALQQTDPDVSLHLVPPEVPLESGHLLEMVSGHPRLTVMGALLEASGLADVLSGEERYTVLAPTDTAFVRLTDEYGDKVLAALLMEEHRALLTELMRYHVLPDQYLLVNTYRDPDQAVPTLYYPPLSEARRMPLFELAIPLPAELPLSLKSAETLRLGQVGSPVGATRTMIDPDNPAAGTRPVQLLNTATGETSLDLEPVREIHFSIENYTDGIHAFNFWVYFRNSTIVTIVATLITLLINSMAAYGLSKYKFFGRDLIFIVIISTLMVPVSVILIPAFLVISRVGWVNNLWGLIIPGAATPTGVFLLRQYMLTIPDELLDAARIDGASEWRIFWQVILPLARPALAVLAIFSVMWRWNDFLWPLVVVSKNELFTLPVGLNAFQGALDVQWHYILAMTVLTLLPITVVFAFLQRYITSGIATTGMK